MDGVQIDRRSGVGLCPGHGFRVPFREDVVGLVKMPLGRDRSRNWVHFVFGRLAVRWIPPGTVDVVAVGRDVPVILAPPFGKVDRAGRFVDGRCVKPKNEVSVHHIRGDIRRVGVGLRAHCAERVGVDWAGVDSCRGGLLARGELAGI